MIKQTKIMIHSITLSLVFSVAIALGAETAARGDKISKEDADFVKEAASGGMMEVQLGKTAQETRPMRR